MSNTIKVCNFTVSSFEISERDDNAIFDEVKQALAEIFGDRTVSQHKTSTYLYSEELEDFLSEKMIDMKDDLLETRIKPYDY